MASASAIFNFSASERLPPGPRGPCPGLICNRLLPRLEISAVTWAVAPFPSVTMLMTAATPMTIPRVVSADLMTLRRISRRAKKTVSQSIIL